MGFLTVVLIVIWALSALGMILLVMAHSGKGTGVSDMIASTMYNAQSGTNVLERNLDRLTLIFAIVFAVCVLLMMIVYPLGTIG